MRCRALGLLKHRAGLGVLLALAGCAEQHRPNVVLISIDTLRADHLGCYGYARPTSPRIDELAREGVRFERAVSTTSWTLPAHLSMLSGLPISVHGICDDRHYDRLDAAGERVAPPLRGSLVSESLRDAGYATAGFYTWKYLDDSFGFDVGFDIWERCGWELSSHPTVARELMHLREIGDVEGMRALARDYSELFDPTRRTSPETIDRAISWLDGQRARDPEQPFFLFVHLFDVHEPYLPPPAFDRFGDPSYRGPVDGRRVGAVDAPVFRGMPSADLERLIALYDGGIAYVDDQVGRLIEHLDRAGLAEDTLVILTSDHGEEFFEHGDKSHRRQLYLESVQVPLILRWKGRLPAGRTSGGTVGLIDVAPTILAAARASPRSPMVGVDLTPIAAGDAANVPRSYTSVLFVFDEGTLLERQVGLLEGDEHTLVTYCPGEPWRAVRFDLASDPRELGTVSAGELDVPLARLRVAFAALRARLPQRGAELRELDEVEKKQLSKLGYASLSETVTASGDESRLCIDGCIWGPD